MLRGCSRISILGVLRADSNLDGRENRARSLQKIENISSVGQEIHPNTHLVLSQYLSGP